jgi:CheY-like chemotaxis protein
LDYLFGTGQYSKRKPVRPQLILLVLDLPGMSGAEFLRRVKGDERTRDTRCAPDGFALTASLSTEAAQLRTSGRFLPRKNCLRIR